MPLLLGPPVLELHLDLIDALGTEVRALVLERGQGQNTLSLTEAGTLLILSPEKVEW